MGIFAFLLLVIAGLRLAGSSFALMPLAGDYVTAAAVAHPGRHDLYDVDAPPLDDHVASAEL